jgi:cellulose synthase/poly-beta-1,6-N-acetylglucosamine synthase-like glycosyltransferase
MILIPDTNLEMALAFIESLNLGSLFFSLSNILLFAVLVAINVIWIHLFVISMRTFHRVPKISHSLGIDRGKLDLSTNDRLQDIGLPFVSIIVPARNEETEIGRCLTSLLNQTYPKFEIIAIDDNSNDNTLKVMQMVEAEYCENTNLALKSRQYERYSFMDEIRTDIPSINGIASSSDDGRGKGDDSALTVSIQHINSVMARNNDRLTIISLKDKPKGWTAKTWASQQGFLCSKGEILIFTDADTYYVDKDAIMAAIAYLRKKNLDVLTGFPLIELRDFWSKVVNPVWQLIGTLFGTNVADINNPKANVAYLNGCFIVIKRKVFQEIGTFNAVRHSIREDEALGIRTKELGYKIRGVCMDECLTALWSRDLHTLWHGIARSVVPLFLDRTRKGKIVNNLFILFLMGTLPFIILPYTLFMSEQPSSGLMISHINPKTSAESTLANQLESLSRPLFALILPLNLPACVLLFVSSAAKAKWQFKISPAYACMSPVAVVFLVIAYTTHILSLTIVHRKLGKTVEWQGRKYFFPPINGSKSKFR